MNKEEYLKQIDSVIANGYYKDNWGSLSKHKTPEWYRNSKFGIFVCWGIYTVPEYGDEWYPRMMYLKNQPTYKHHVETYGDVDKFGYKDFLPMFKGEKFNPDELAAAFKESGAKYVQPIAVFCDGFQMYDSDLHEFNCKNYGPKVDFLGEMKKAVEKQNLTFCASSHLAENYWFFNGGRKIKSDVLDPKYADFYGPAALPDEVIEEDDLTKHYIRKSGPDKEFLEKWLTSTCEFVDKYHPKVVFFDWWIENLKFKPYLKKFAAYYYNRALEWGEDVTLTYKHDAYGLNCGTYDIERGQMSGINPNFWQCDTSIAKNSWCYTTGNDFKKPNDIICDLIDVVSKNGCMLLNVGPKSDGTLCDEEKAILKQIGKWMRVNGEGIYDTSFWKMFGEGPTEVPEGYFSDTTRSNYTEEDIRYTYKEGNIYAFVLGKPNGKTVTMKALNFPKTGDEMELGTVTLLGSDKTVNYKRDENGLIIEVPKIDDVDYYPLCYKIETI